MLRNKLGEINKIKRKKSLATVKQFWLAKMLEVERVKSATGSRQRVLLLLLFLHEQEK